MLIRPALAHQAGIIDSHISVRHTTVNWVYTLPNVQLDTLYLSNFLLDNNQNNVKTLTPSQALPYVINNLYVFNNNDRCRIVKADTNYLAKIKSAQFFLTWRCKNILDNVLLRDKNAILPNSTVSMEMEEISFSSEDESKKRQNYKNFTRLSIAGQSKNFLFSKDQMNHKIPVGSLLNLWQKTLVDDVLNEGISTELKHVLSVINDRNNAPTNMVNNSNNQLSASILLDESKNYNDFWQARHFINVGFEHILLGLDHVLFLIGLMLLITNVRQLVLFVTCFTLAHSVSLTLSVMDVVNAPISVIESLIALTIIYVAIENIWLLKKVKSGKSLSQLSRYRWLLILIFGFIHGFGFSFILKQIGHEEDLLASLLFFNLGVELGQLLIVLPMFLGLRKFTQIIINDRSSISTNHKLRMGLSYFKYLVSVMTGLMGYYWFLLRSF
ncbi:MAG: HupE/UreJ family protein [Colwellia sp.]|nr:HupE/UreJ family protein [Colwellia sp.]